MSNYKFNFRYIALISLVILSTFTACRHQHGHDDHGEEAEAGPEPLVYTIYTDKTELFVEFKPLVVGGESKFAAHFTVLGDSFTALSEGTVTVSMNAGGKVIKNTATAPSTPGIFRLALQPTVAGTGTLVFDIQTKDYTDRIEIAGVKVYADEKAALADQPEGAAAGEISYLKEQAWKVEFANAPLTRQVFYDIIKTSGQILSAPGDETMVTAKVSGIVRLMGSRTMVGSAVGQGSSLFQVQSNELVKGNLTAYDKETKANYDRAKADYDRASELVKDKIISEKEFLEAKLRWENAQNDIARSNVATSYTNNGQNITSPISGYVKDLLVSEGQFVEAGTPLAVISKNKSLVLQAHLSQKYFNKLSTITAANFTITGSDEVYSTRALNGRVISYGKSASSGSPFIPINFSIDNKAGMLPGAVAEVFLQSAPLADALLLPVSSLIEEQGSFFVYVQTGGESFQKREIQLGAGDGMQVQVLSGVAEGERVVTKGAYQIKLSTASGTLPAHGHEH